VVTVHPADFPNINYASDLTAHTAHAPLCLQDFVSDVADLNPEYCVGSILQDLLASDSPDAQLIALRTLHLVATSVPADSAAALDVRASMPRRSTALAGSSSSWLGGGRGAGGRRMVQVGLLQLAPANHCSCTSSMHTCGKDLASLGVLLAGFSVKILQQDVIACCYGRV
jgi:hypothetical protein